MKGTGVALLELKWPNWIGVVVEDLEAQRLFYRDVMGFKELEAGLDWVQFDLGWPNLFELVRRSHEPQYDRVRYQIGYSVEDIHTARENLIARGVTAITEIEGGPESGGYWSYLRDPEGNVFEISKRVGEP
jgi:predicted enzyme related to lactoylglutathione lyase